MVSDFDTIAGYKAHGAIVHYEANPETDIPLNRRYAAAGQWSTIFGRNN